MDKYKEFSNLGTDDLIKIIYEKNKEIEKLNEFIRHLVLQKDLNEENKILKENTSKISLVKFDQKWDWVKKIIYIVTEMNQPCLSTQILPILLKYDSVAPGWYDKGKSFSVYLNKAVKYKRLIAYKVGGMRGYYYLLPTWVDERGQLLKKFQD